MTTISMTLTEQIKQMILKEKEFLDKFIWKGEDADIFKFMLQSKIEIWDWILVLI